MKHALVIAALCLAAGCTSRTEYGRCIGVQEPDAPGLVYQYNVGNLFFAAYFWETVVIPVVVLSDRVKCPVGKVQP